MERNTFLIISAATAFFALLISLRLLSCFADLIGVLKLVLYTAVRFNLGHASLIPIVVVVLSIIPASVVVALEVETVIILIVHQRGARFVLLTRATQPVFELLGRDCLALLIHIQLCFYLLPSFIAHEASEQIRSRILLDKFFSFAIPLFNLSLLKYGLIIVGDEIEHNVLNGAVSSHCATSLVNRKAALFVRVERGLHDHKVLVVSAALRTRHGLVVVTLGALGSVLVLCGQVALAALAFVARRALKQTVGRAAGLVAHVLGQLRHIVVVLLALLHGGTVALILQLSLQLDLLNNLVVLASNVVHRFEVRVLVLLADLHLKHGLIRTEFFQVL